MKTNKKVISIVLNNFKNDSRVLKENISLQNAGYVVQVVALHEEPSKEFDTVQNIPVHRVKLVSRSWSKNTIIQLLKYLEFLFRVIKKYRKADIFHCNDLNALPIGVLIKLFFNCKAKIVYDAHEYEINDIPNQSKVSIKINFYTEKLFIRFANKVITVSDSIANEYQRLYKINKPSLVLNTPPYKTINKKNIFRETLGIREEQTIFLYQGGLSQGRGIEILLETFKSIKNDKKVIVFMGHGALESLIITATKKYQNIYFHKAVNLDVLLEHTSSADFGILFYENTCLNHYYCSPNKIFEYLMAGLPVIVSNLYEMKKIVEAYKIGVVAKKNTPMMLAESIERASKLDKLELSNNIQKIKKIYNWEEQEKVLLNVYGELF